MSNSTTKASAVSPRRRKWAGAVAGVAALAVGGRALMFFAATTSGAPHRGATTSSPTSAPAASSSNAYANNYYAKHTEAAKAATLVYDGVLARYQAGTATLEDVVKWSERLRDTSYQSGNAAEEHRDRMRKLESEVQKRVAAGTSPTVEQDQMAYFRAIAEASAP